ncbi:hypothetical protein [Pseudoxanthomonas winnipegensis]|uniref:DUF2946 domain-containing protein n=1 Tax=Pseudoxanthomonas winnipegensis TaxID=2480810 RepID=A0A4Q8LDJ8_9GAMM|nr:hypothetical protein [Pseudoxanthomonas winnipegensis]TAA26660.1 hypothetical protein EA660_05410 [Pseudoxanthomonas winnipegensis]
MSLRLVHRCLSWLRLPALAMLLLAVLANPVLAAVGDLHEATRGNAAHLHQADEHALAADADAGDDAGDLLHALMHAAHCCGHLTAIPSQFAPPPMALARAVLQARVMLPARSHTPSLALRPPIAA